MKRIFKVLFLCVCSLFIGSFVGQKIETNEITTRIIKEAQIIFGLEFTDLEVDSVVSNLSNYRLNYEKMRGVQLDNNIAPVLIFNPLPDGFKVDKSESFFKPSIVKKVNFSKSTPDFAYMSIGELAYLIKSKTFSSVEITKYFIERIKKYDTKLQCIITVTEDLALKQAAKADYEISKGKYRGLLHGIPYVAKDLLAVKNYKTTWGSVPYKNQVIDLDATVIKRLEAAGAILCAKTTLGELAMGDVWFGGKTKNPWDLNRGSSGSSAGSASAVSAGLIPFAIGSETLGSIVSPSSECGTTGLRPTFGRVPRTGAMALSWSMDKLGPICRNVEDCAIVFNTIFGSDGYDQSVIEAAFKYDAKKGLKGLRIGYLQSEFNLKYPTQKQDSMTILTLRKLGADLIPIELPHLLSNELSFLLTVEAAAAFEELTLNGKDDLMVRQLKNAWPNSFRSARFVPAVEYIQANRHRKLLIEELNKVLTNIDVYVSPSFGRNLTMTNLTGHPCIVLPNGMRAEGRPTSITFIGKLFGEGKLLQFAKAYQDATEWNKIHPRL